MPLAATPICIRKKKEREVCESRIALISTLSQIRKKVRRTNRNDSFVGRNMDDVGVFRDPWYVPKGSEGRPDSAHESQELLSKFGEDAFAAHMHIDAACILQCSAT